MLTDPVNASSRVELPAMQFALVPVPVPVALAAVRPAAADTVAPDVPRPAAVALAVPVAPTPTPLPLPVAPFAPAIAMPVPPMPAVVVVDGEVVSEIDKLSRDNPVVWPAPAAWPARVDEVGRPETWPERAEEVVVCADANGGRANVEQINSNGVACFILGPPRPYGPAWWPSSARRAAISVSGRWLTNADAVGCPG